MHSLRLEGEGQSKRPSTGDRRRRPRRRRSGDRLLRGKPSGMCASERALGQRTTDNGRANGGEWAECRQTSILVSNFRISIREHGPYSLLYVVTLGTRAICPVMGRFRLVGRKMFARCEDGREASMEAPRLRNQSGGRRLEADGSSDASHARNWLVVLPVFSPAHPSHGPAAVGSLSGAVSPKMQTAHADNGPPRAASDDSDRTIGPNNSESPYFLQDTEAIDFALDTHRIDHLSLEEVEDENIYRGEHPARPRSPSSTSVSSSTSSTSSASSVFGGRLGAISAVVEHAIATWARAWASSSSLSTSSSSKESIVTVSRSQLARRRKRMSLADIQNQRSEREIAARIRAREDARYISRAFDLYVPDYLDAGAGEDIRERSFLHTESLPLLMARLGAALKEHGRAKRARPEVTTPEPPHSQPPALYHDYMMPEEPVENVPGPSGPSAHHDAHIRRKVRKGKRRAGTAQASAHIPPASSSSSESDGPEKAWWLDVSSPTWEDMRAIGKVRRVSSIMTLPVHSCGSSCICTH